MRKLRKALWLLGKGHHWPLLKRFRRWLWHDEVALGLEYDPRVPVTARLPTMSLEVRPIRDDEIRVFTSLPPSGSGRVEALTRTNARDLLESGLKTCYVGVTADGPIYMQFLITAEENDRVAEVFGPLFPPLAEDEGLLEFAYTLQQHRARPVMPTVLLRLIEIAGEQGVRRLTTYVHVANAGFLRFFLRLGFQPHTVRVEKSRLLRRQVEFLPIDHELLERFGERADVNALTNSLLRPAVR